MNRPIVQDILRLAAIAAVGLITLYIGLLIWGSWHDEWSGYNANTRVSDGICNIAVLPIAGDIIPYDGAYKDGITPDSDFPPTTDPDRFSYMLRLAQEDPYILGALVRIDSPGGALVASEIMANLLKRADMPVASLIRELGVSAGYLAATGADTIIASPLSDVGSIGVTMSYLENTKQNLKEGLEFISLASTPLKDGGNPNKPLTAQERALMERDLKIYHEQFVAEVAANRNMPVEDVSKLADGSSMPGTLALTAGLVDTLGDQDTARKWFAEQLELSSDEVIFCE